MGKAGNVCMLLGTALVLAALSLFLWNQREAAEAGRAAEAVLPRLVENMEAARTKPTTPDAHMEYGAYGSAPDGLPEKFGLTDTIGRKPFCEVGVFFIGQPGFHNMAAVGGVVSLRHGL